MNKKFWVIALTVVLVIGLGVTAAWAKFARHGGPAGFMAWRHLAQVEARLKLTPEQSKQIHAIVRREADRFLQPAGGPADERSALAKEIFRDNPDPAEVRRRAEALKQQHARMLDQVVAAGLEVNQLLNREQRAEMQEIIAEHAQVGAKMRERFRQHLEERE